MNLIKWFRTCRRQGHEFTAWKQVEALPVPFLCCRVCGKDAPEDRQREFFKAWIQPRVMETDEGEEFDVDPTDQGTDESSDRAA